ncbi:MAG: 50S ribosomal protein L12 [archaeon]|nr:50S ribosomal protein L12 [archaeon]
MQYVYGALLLHSAGKPVDEASLKKVVEASGTATDEAQVKALVASLDGVDIEQAIKEAAIPVAAPAAASPEEGGEAKEEKSAGLSALFG